MNAGFRRTLALAGDGDVVYCDPPYEPLPGTAGFTNYAAGGFSWDSQVELAESCVAAHQRGAKVVISNSTAPRVIELYEQHGSICTASVLAGLYPAKAVPAKQRVMS